MWVTRIGEDFSFETVNYSINMLIAHNLHHLIFFYLPIFNNKRGAVANNDQMILIEKMKMINSLLNIKEVNGLKTLLILYSINIQNTLNFACEILAIIINCTDIINSILGSTYSIIFLYIEDYCRLFVIFIHEVKQLKISIL